MLESHLSIVCYTSLTTAFGCTDGLLLAIAGQSGHCESVCSAVREMDRDPTVECQESVVLSACLAEKGQIAKHRSAAEAGLALQCAYNCCAQFYNMNLNVSSGLWQDKV